MNTSPESSGRCENCQANCFAEGLIRALGSTIDKLDGLDVAFSDPRAVLVRGVHAELVKACRLYGQTAEETGATD